MNSSDTNEQILSRLRNRESLSVQLPAGAGKTETIATLARDCAQLGLRSLVLTHTHAGVDALKVRVHRKYSVSRDSCRIRTIAGWAFKLIRAYPLLAGYQAPDLPNYRDSERYYQACSEAISSREIRRMIANSYDVVIVDEYQDCVVAQHQVILQLAASVPTIVLGDPLQSLFNFNGNVPVVWTSDVLPVFVPVELSSIPWRWHNGNKELGDWLIEIREPLAEGKTIDLSDAPVDWRKLPRREWRAKAYKDALDDVDIQNRNVAALGRWPADVIQAAWMFGGRMHVMEEVEGKFMLRSAEELLATPDTFRALKTIEFAKKCAIGVAEVIDSAKVKRVAEGKLISTRNPKYQSVFESINTAITDPTMANLKRILEGLSELEEVRIYCYEAWLEVVGAMATVSRDNSLVLTETITRRREALRHRGRQLGSRIVSRPLLVKGLEFDHVILLDPARYSPEELYVALSRACRSVTVFSESSNLSPRV